MELMVGKSVNEIFIFTPKFEKKIDRILEILESINKQGANNESK
ncbi:MAG: hypothetical protein ACRCXT_12410 [Paraclostridium sp.]